MSIACVLVPSLALACELVSRSHLVGRAVALTDEAQTHVLDCTPEAARYNVRAGLPLRMATTLCPALVVLKERPAQTARAASALVESVAAISPVVEDAGPG